MLANKRVSPQNVHIIMAFDPAYGKLIGDQYAEINKAYAEQYGFNFHKLDPDSSKYVYPHYKRYIALQKLLREYPDNTYFFYIDGDAAIVQNDLDIRDWFQEIDSETYVLFGNEVGHDDFSFKKRMILRILLQNIAFNSGVIVVRNNQWSRSFVDSILDPSQCNHAKDDKGFLVNFFKTKDQNCIGNIYAKNAHQEKKHIKVIPFDYRIQQFSDDFHDSNIPISHAVSRAKFSQNTKK